MEGGVHVVTGVSVLKPVVGVPMDPHLMANLETFFTMDYPKVRGGEGLDFSLQRRENYELFIIGIQLISWEVGSDYTYVARVS